MAEVDAGVGVRAGVCDGVETTDGVLVLVVTVLESLIGLELISNVCDSAVGVRSFISSLPRIFLSALFNDLIPVVGEVDTDLLFISGLNSGVLFNIPELVDVGEFTNLRLLYLNLTIFVGDSVNDDDWELGVLLLVLYLVDRVMVVLV